jgi:hypothetical protein
MAPLDHGKEDNLVATYPVVGTTAVATLAVVAYVGIQLVLYRSVNPVETGVFALAFTLVYVGFHWAQAWLVDRSEETATDEAETDDPAESG